MTDRTGPVLWFHVFTNHVPALPAMKTCLALPFVLMWAAALPAPAADAPAPPKTPELRKPGFIFLELNTRRREEYAAFFEAAMGFHIKSQGPKFIELETDIAQILLNDPDGLPAGHPFYKKFTGDGQGFGVEIGLVVADLDKAFAAAKKQGWKISVGIGMRPWGERDFRVLSPDGYYLRFTEAQHGR